MNQKERNILKLEESFRDTIENDILKQQTEIKKIKILETIKNGNTIKKY